MEADRGPPMFSRDFARNFSARDKLSWTHLELIRRQWKGTLVVKGLLSVDDVRRAREIGTDGVILSNHGGRQLDHAVAPLRVLPRIKAEVPGLTIMIDGSIRRGTDVLKALALGAAAVFVGRPFIYAAAIAGVPGVLHASKLLSDEIDRDMALLGVTKLAALSQDYLIAAR
jgi:L-lactate dehydrogenase (cytochrome)